MGRFVYALYGLLLLQFFSQVAYSFLPYNVLAPDSGAPGARGPGLLKRLNPRFLRHCEQLRKLMYQTREGEVSTIRTERTDLDVACVVFIRIATVNDQNLFTRRTSHLAAQHSSKLPDSAKHFIITSISYR